MAGVYAILLAAGRGKRLKGRISKPLIRLNAKPLLCYSLEVLNAHPAVKEIVVVVNRQNQAGIKWLTKKFRKVKDIILGGRRRQDSVRNGLKVIAKNNGFVLIHDAARPFVNGKIISRLVKKAEKSGAAIAAIPLKSTIKSVVRETVEKTLPRDNLWEVQTPQVFRKNLILMAYERFGKENATDDAMLAEKMGIRVSVVFGAYENIKITTPIDLVTAEAILKKAK